jgi:hypothetical protein
MRKYTAKVLMRMKTRAKHDAPVQSHWRSWKSGKKWLCGVSIFLGVLLIGVSAVPTLEEGAESVICRILRWMRVSADFAQTGWVQVATLPPNNTTATAVGVADEFALAFSTAFNIGVRSATGQASLPSLPNNYKGYHISNTLVTPPTNASPAFSGIFEKTADLDTHDKLLAAGYTTNSTETIETITDKTTADATAAKYVGGSVETVTVSKTETLNFDISTWESFSKSNSTVRAIYNAPDQTTEGNLTLQPAGNIGQFNGSFTYPNNWKEKEKSSEYTYADFSQNDINSLTTYLKDGMEITFGSGDSAIPLHLGDYVTWEEPKGLGASDTNKEHYGYFPVLNEDDSVFHDEHGSILLVLPINLYVGQGPYNFNSLYFVFGGGTSSTENTTAYKVTAPIYTRPEIPATPGSSVTTYDYKYAYGDQLLQPTIDISYPAGGGKTVSGVATQQKYLPSGAANGSAVGVPYTSGGPTAVGTTIRVSYYYNNNGTPTLKTVETATINANGSYSLAINDAIGGTVVTVTPAIRQQFARTANAAGTETILSTYGNPAITNLVQGWGNSTSLYATNPNTAPLKVQGRFIPVDNTGKVISAINASGTQWAFGPVDPYTNLSSLLPTVPGYTRTTTTATAPQYDGNINVTYIQNPNRVVPVDATTGVKLPDIPDQPNQYPDENGNVTVPDLSSYGYSLAASVEDADPSKEGIQVPADLTDGLTDVPYTKIPLPLPMTGYDRLVDQDPMSLVVLAGALVTAFIAFISCLQHAIARLNKRHKD